MSYEVIPTKLFLEQLEDLSVKTKNILRKKIGLLKINPTRNKRIKGYNLFMFRVRFSDSKKEKRLIYLLDKNKVKILCILNRDKNYKDLKGYLKKVLEWWFFCYILDIFVISLDIVKNVSVGVVLRVSHGRLRLRDYLIGLVKIGGENCGNPCLSFKLVS